MESPRNVSENIKILPDVTNVSSPIQRNLVKRNLNKSFGNSANETNNSILNYSIVSDEDIDNPLVLKLKISEGNKTPLVVLRKLNDTYSVSKTPIQKQSTTTVESTSIRKSTRIKERKSYADYISPIKRSPINREVSYIISHHEDVESTPVKNLRTRHTRITKDNFQTPTKSVQRSENSPPQRRTIRTPKRYQDVVNSPYKKLNLQGSARKSLGFTQADEHKDVTSTPRTTSKNKKQHSPIKEQDNGTPKKEINLDESIRRSILKTRFNKDLSQSTQRQSKSNTNLYYSSSESDDDVSSRQPNITNSITPVTPKTPKPPPKTKTTNSMPSITEDSLNLKEIVLKTPKTNDSKTPKKLHQTPKSPRDRAKLIRNGIITPFMHSRSNAVIKDSTPLMKARSQLHVSYVPIALPCREKEYCDVLNFLEGKLLDGCGGCMYISGVPGTGKTATVTSVINNLSKSDDVPNFTYISINGMRLTEPRQSYVEILKQLDGKTVPWEQAQSILEEKFTKSKKQTPLVMLIDELDILCTKRQDVVYNLLDWPTKAKNQLIVVTIANTMDLPERLLMNRVTSRLGLTRLTFQAYTHKQLQEIVTKRLTGTNIFNPDAIQLVARKVASVSGDARRALDICRRAAEIAESEGEIQLVNMNHVNEALNAMITQPKVRAIKNCSRLEQLILQSIVAEVERTGVEETTFADVFEMLISCAAIDGFRMVSSTNALSAVSRLSACRLILADAKCSDITQKLILNVSVDDVYYALKRD